MRTVTLTRGLPASGKSTWAKELVAQSNGTIVRVNMDDIRAMLALPYSKDAEELALQIQDKTIVQAVKAGKDVVVDNTHIEKKMPTRIKKLFDGDVAFEVKDFSHVNVEECVTRDVYRGICGERSVGEQVIRRMASRMTKWTLTEEFMNDTILSPPLEYDPELPWAIVIDTDGTTAHHRRSPYDYARCGTDIPDKNMQELIPTLFEYYTVIGMSGRPDTWRDETEKWYQDNGIPFDSFHMRAEGDNRNDADVKQEMVDKHIRGKVNVLMWFDDRDRVVRRLRKLNIKVSQVAEGDF